MFTDEGSVEPGTCIRSTAPHGGPGFGTLLGGHGVGHTDTATGKLHGDTLAQAVAAQLASLLTAMQDGGSGDPEFDAAAKSRFDLTHDDVLDKSGSFTSYCSNLMWGPTLCGGPTSSVGESGDLKLHPFMDLHQKRDTSTGLGGRSGRFIESESSCKQSSPEAIDESFFFNNL